MNPVGRWGALLAIVMSLLHAGCGDADDDSHGAENGRLHAAQINCTPTGSQSGLLRIRARWSTGDTWPLTITKSREDPAEPSEQISLTSQGELQVLKERPSGYLMRWSLENVPLMEAAGGAEGAEELAELSEAMSIRYTANRNGVYLRVQNVSEVRNVLRELVDRLAERAQSEEERAAVEQSREIVLSDEFIQTSITTEIQALHYPYGFDLRPDKVQRTSGFTPNPFGGPPIPATTRVRLAEAADGAGCAVLQANIKPDAEELLAAFGRAIELDGETAGNLEALQVDLKSELRARYDPASGVVTGVRDILQVEVPGQRQVTRTKITVGDAK
jgi:hypothetical protein